MDGGGGRGSSPVTVENGGRVKIIRSGQLAGRRELDETGVQSTLLEWKTIGRRLKTE